MLSANFQSVIRHALTLLAGTLVTKGYITNADVELIVGAIVTLISVGWSIYANYRGSKAVKKDEAGSAGLVILLIVAMAGAGINVHTMSENGKKIETVDDAKAALKASYDDRQPVDYSIMND